MNKSDAELDLIRVEKAFHKRIPGFCGPLSAEKTPHGQSNPTYIISSKSGKYVLRRKPDGVLLPSAHAVEREFRVMTALAESELPVPRTYFLCEDPEEIGAVFFVMDYVSGKVFTDPGLPGLSISERTYIYDQMNLGLAKLHKLKPEMFGLSDYGRPGNYFERQYSRWSRQYEVSATDSISEMEELQKWLKSNIPIEDGSQSLVHGDWRIDNLIYKNGPFKLAIESNTKIIPVTMPNNKSHFPWNYFRGKPGILNIEVHAPICKSNETNNIKDLNTKVYNTIFDKLTDYEN